MKKNNILITLLIICILIIVGLGCIVGYLVLNDNSKNSNSNDVEDSLKPEQIKVGQVGSLSQRVDLINFYDENGIYYETAELVIKNNKLFLEYNEQSKEIDVNGENVIRVERTGNCSGNNNILVLTENGNIYTWYDNVAFPESFGPINVIFEKINTDEKIYGIETINPKSSCSCCTPGIYAYTKEKTRKYVNVVEKTLGETYEEMYPYEDFIGLFMDCNDIYRYSDGKITFGSNEFIKYEGKELKIKNGYYDNYSSDDTINVYLVSDTNKVYLFTTNRESSCQNYEIKDTGKVVSFVNFDEYSDIYTGDIHTKVMLVYTDGTNSEIFDTYMNENFK